MTGQQQQRSIHKDLLPSENPGLLAVCQHRDEVVLRFLHPFLDHGNHILVHASHTIGQLTQAVGLAPADAQQFFGQHPDVVALFFRYAHHLGDDEDGKRNGQVAHQVNSVAPRLGRVQKFFGSRLYQRPPFFHGLRREIGMDDLTHLKMFRPVVLDEHLTLVISSVIVKFGIRLKDRRIWRPGVVGHNLIRELLIIPGQPDQVVVSGDYPEFIKFVPMHRVFVSELTIVLVWVLDNFRREHVVVDRRYHYTTVSIQILFDSC